MKIRATDVADEERKTLKKVELPDRCLRYFLWLWGVPDRVWV